MIVILGAFGKTGRATAAFLESTGKCRVRRVTRDGARVASYPEVVRARLSDDVELASALTGAQAVYSLLPDDLGARAFRAERRAMAEAMARAIARQGVPRVVLLSSAAAALGENAQNGLGADLAYFERIVRSAAAQVTVLRASYFQDNLTQVLASAARDGNFPSFFASRETPIPTIATKDVGQLAAEISQERRNKFGLAVKLPVTQRARTRATSPSPSSGLLPTSSRSREPQAGRRVSAIGEGCSTWWRCGSKTRTWSKCSTPPKWPTTGAP